DMLRSTYGLERTMMDARPLAESVPENSSTSDEVVRFLTDKISVDPSFLTTQLREQPVRAPAHARPNGDSSGVSAVDSRAAGAPASLDAASRKERTFLAMCLAERTHGREYLERLDDDHFSSDAM